MERYSVHRTNSEGLPDKHLGSFRDKGAAIRYVNDIFVESVESAYVLDNEDNGREIYRTKPFLTDHWD